MFTTFDFVFKNFRKIRRHTIIDNTPFWLHYRITTLLLFLGVFVIITRDFTGDYIACVTHDTDSPAIPEKVINTYCYTMSVFTISNGLNEIPGIGPESSQMRTHSYYQWVQYVLFAQGVFFYLPHYFWKHTEGGKIKWVSESMKHFYNASINTDRTVNREKTKLVDDFLDDLCGRLKAYHFWSRYLLCYEVLNVLNLFLQWHLTNLFINHQFTSLGYTAVFNNPTPSILDIVFPKLGKCTYHKYGPSGTIEKHDAMCVLPLNIINEKIYVILWWWYWMLTAISVGVLIWRLLQMCLYKNVYYNSWVWDIKMDQFSYINDFNYSDWLFLNYTASNLPPRTIEFIFRDISRTKYMNNRLISIDDDSDADLKKNG